MSELRFDPFQRRWVVIAPRRGARPNARPPRVQRPDVNPDNCPFCPGHEAQTPPEIAALRPADGKADGPGWTVRVVPNLFAALSHEHRDQPATTGAFTQRPGIGAHEVVIETPNHHAEPATLPEAELRQVLAMYQRRLLALKSDPSHRYVQLFKNHGPESGATLAHPHTQIIAMPIVPGAIVAELDSCRAHYQHARTCMYCDLIEHEVRLGERILATSPEFVALTPYASRFPFEVMVLPRRHSHTFDAVTAGELDAFTRFLQDVLRRLRVALDAPPYNFMLHEGPTSGSVADGAPDPHAIAASYHWHLELVPRLTTQGGFEWGTDVYINPTSPEQAARTLREIVLD